MFILFSSYHSQTFFEKEKLKDTVDLNSQEAFYQDLDLTSEIYENNILVKKEYGIYLY